MPEIGKLSDSRLNRLVGIAPEEKQSGTKEWKRKIWGGRKDVRNALYMAAVASIQWNAILGGYYRKKRAVELKFPPLDKARKFFKNLQLLTL